MSCEPPPITLAGLGRVFSGPYRVELTFNDQQWTQRLLEYEYTVPWRATLTLSPALARSLALT